MSYTTAAKVRLIVGNLQDFELSDSDISTFISWADEIIDRTLGGSAKYFLKEIRFDGNNRFIALEEDISTVNKVWINEIELKQYDDKNLLDDGEVEIEDADETAPEYWTSSGSTATFSWDSSDPYKLRRALKITKGSSGTDYWYSDKVSIEDATPYRAKAHIKTSGLTGNVYLRIRWLDDDGNEISTSDSDPITSDQNYTETEVIATSPVNAAYAQVCLVHAGSAGYCLGDNFYLNKVNWQVDSTNNILELTEKPKVGSLITIRMTLANVPTLVEEISTEIAALYALLYASGLYFAGANFRDLRGAGERVKPTFERLYSLLLAKAENNLALLARFNDYMNADFGTVRMKTLPYMW